eukprot:1183095-Prorocentrum_minimum.AAC.5
MAPSTASTWAVNTDATCDMPHIWAPVCWGVECILAVIGTGGPVTCHIYGHLCGGEQAHAALAEAGGITFGHAGGHAPPPQGPHCTLLPGAPLAIRAAAHASSSALALASARDQKYVRGDNLL